MNSNAAVARDTRRDTRRDHLPSRPWVVHVVADSDTRWKWGASLARQLAAPGGVPARVHGHLLQGRATPNDQQLADVGAAAASVRRVGIAQLLADLAHAVDGGRPDGVRGEAIDRPDVVVLACVGGTVQSLLHGLARAWQGRPRRPVVITGYVGVVYERMVDGLLLRAGADLVLANSAADEQRFGEVFDAVGVDAGTVVRTALPFLAGTPHDSTAAGRSRRFTVTFVSQPSVPETREDRLYLIGQVVEHARTHPNRQVIVKLRGRAGEQTTHIEQHHYATLLPAPDVPGNVEFAYGAMDAVLDRTDLCVTLSSTAALEAMHRGIPTAILTDLGVREALGNHFYLHSGALTSWRALHVGEIPKADPGWVDDNGAGAAVDEPYARLGERIAGLLADPDGLRPLRPWLNLDDAGGYLPALLARNGLDVDGAPLMTDPAWGRADPGRLRRYARAAARRAYRVGVQRFEPRVRKWAQL